MSKISNLRSALDQQKGQKLQLEKSIAGLRKDLERNNQDLINHEKAREVIRIAGEEAQKSLSYHISEITSLALEAVFDNPYTLEVEFIERRNKTECDLYFSRDGNRVDPMDASGGGAVDVASFALRIASWSMQTPRSRALVLLDEPFNRLKGEEANLRVLNMIKEISKKLNLQIIAVSDERVNRDDLISKADKTFLVEVNKRGRSKISVIEKQDESEYGS